MLDHPDLLLILERQRRDDLARLPRRNAAPPPGEGTPLRVSLARSLRQLADRLEPRRSGAGHVHA